MSLGLFQDLFIRMFVIVGVFDFLMWWIMNKGTNNKTIIFLFIVEMAVITISLWFDVIYRKKNLKR
jgi:hypothetical protein